MSLALRPAEHAVQVREDGRRLEPRQAGTRGAGEGVGPLAAAPTHKSLRHVNPYLLATVVTPINWYIIQRAGKVQGAYGVVQNSAMAGANAAGSGRRHQSAAV